MKVERLARLNQLGQSMWYDNIRRALLDSGAMEDLIEAGVSGVTSNPTIFEKAIAGSTDYDPALTALAEAGKSVAQIYETLALEDIRRTADLLRPVYDATDGADGYVSLEVSPTLAHDTDGTVQEARRLFKALGRPNVMIKVPATPEGVPAIETLIGEGVNVNVTLIFSLAQYEAVGQAYIAGVERLAAGGKPPAQVASVASFFVSRVDTAVDRALQDAGETALQGKIAIANAKTAYARFCEIFSGARWDALAGEGARVQRPLWASTGVKNPQYPDTLYVDSLIGPQTVNTAPPATLQAFIDHGTVEPTLEAHLDAARAQLARLGELGIDLEAITQQLQDDGVAAFAESFASLMAGIEAKRARLQAGRRDFTARLGNYGAVLNAALDDLTENRIVARIWEHDHRVWKGNPSEIRNRLGWLHIADVMLDHAGEMQALLEDVRADGYTHALLLGMGGSSLAPEVFRETFGVAEGALDLAVLDSTDPGAVLAQAERLDPARTLFIVSTKSGGTIETLSFFKYFYNRVADALGSDQAGAHFIAITDPGSRLEALARQHNFRATFLNDTTIGGRYSALSYFGLVPAALAGVDVPRLLDRALTAMCGSEFCVHEADNPGAWLGAIMGELAKAGRDKVTLVASPPIASFSDWVEQLIAESTGKEGKGILPVVGEPLGAPELYGDDRLFVYMRLDGDDTHDAALQRLEEAGHPVVYLHLPDLYGLGALFFIWEFATAVAGQRLGINPFDQPNVEGAKARAREMMAVYADRGTLSTEMATLTDGNIAVYGNVDASSVGEALTRFLGKAEVGDYVALQAYVQPTAETDQTLAALRLRLRERTKLATTVGYGPRFLHSTGQLHKGDAGNGLFVQITADAPHDVDIPDKAGEPASSIRFGVLIAAQALGDAQALREAKPPRRVIRFHLGTDVVGGLERLLEALA
ncbi:MAG: bifunctional transaldolase/phosoglucose isomerase [Anaerolineae bacterium]|nr:bifunctional transaldolase/phosoglucose isomerase [Anaerolineae bacterium]